MKVWTTMACVGLVALSSARVDAQDLCVSACREILKPVCGSDGKTYENQCMFEYQKCSTKDDSLKVVAEGACASSSSGSGGGNAGSSCVKACTKIMLPVCGSNGKTYNNECEFNNAKCTDPKLTLASKGECGGSSAGSAGGQCGKTMCLTDYTPVCGSDGKTYSNECNLNNAKCKSPSLTMVSTGECGGKSKMGSGGGEDSEVGSKKGSQSTVTSAPTTKAPTPKPSSGVGSLSVQAAAVVVASVASFLL